MTCQVWPAPCRSCTAKWSLSEPTDTEVTSLGSPKYLCLQQITTLLGTHYDTPITHSADTLLSSACKAAVRAARSFSWSNSTLPLGPTNWSPTNNSNVWVLAVKHSSFLLNPNVSGWWGILSVKDAMEIRTSDWQRNTVCSRCWIQSWGHCICSKLYLLLFAIQTEATHSGFSCRDGSLIHLNNIRYHSIGIVCIVYDIV